MNRKYPNIEFSAGLKNSFEVLKRLKKISEIKDYDIHIGAFTNCREVGLTFYVGWKNDKSLKEGFTFCIYEHRNSNQIILNGKKGYITLNGDLPYKRDGKWDYITSAGYEEYEKITNSLVKEILKLK